MLLIGLLLILLALVVGGAILADATEAETIEVFGVSVDTTGAGVFVAGAVTMLSLLIGLWMVRLAMARSRRRRAEVKSLKRDRNESLSRLEQEKADLAAQLERERAAHEQAGSAPAYPQSVGADRHDSHDSDTSRRGGLKAMFDRDGDGSVDRDDTRRGDASSTRGDHVDLTGRETRERH
jgi:hypothetical protein